jgi:hypothetical protein
VNLRQALITQAPSLELQRAAHAEIARLDAIIGGPTNAPPRFSHIGAPHYGKIMAGIEGVMSVLAQLHASGVHQDDWPSSLTEVRRLARLTHVLYSEEHRKASRIAENEL